eukprot:TRINITY_DN1838_c0_g1_i1.p1 TRINITY_DN1838_c0_g1~~TRINITY_DN1838_c0_g1_i1.p1  ORF type:complete len:352 (-),score=91.74 TRINITY_DN1838_c0_g1_i1:189-1199(-)
MSHKPFTPTTTLLNTASPYASTNDTSLFLNIGYSASPVSCKVHPMVVFSVLDHYVRREENQPRVIGALLGLNYDGVIEIKNSFPIPHHDIDENHEVVAIDKDFHKNMLELHQRANPSEIIVGWYATGSDVNESSVLIHDFFWREMQLTNQHYPPVHLLVPTELKDQEEMTIRAYVSSPLNLSQASEKPLGVYFQPLQFEFVTFEAERFAVDQLIKHKSEEESQTWELPSDLATLESSIRRLLKLITDVSNYVDNVVAGTTPGDTQIGRHLMETLALILKVDSNTFEKLFNSNLQDLLMTSYLSNITRTQLILSERLLSSNPILLSSINNQPTKENI